MYLRLQKICILKFSCLLVLLPEILWRFRWTTCAWFKLRLGPTTLNSFTTSVASCPSSNTILTRPQPSTPRTGHLITSSVTMSTTTTVTATPGGYPPLRRPLASRGGIINSPNNPRAVSNPNPNPNKRPRSPDPSLPTAAVVAHRAPKRLKTEHIAATFEIGKEHVSVASTTSKQLPSAATKPAKRSKAEKAAAEEEFRVKYGRAFPSWKFYFEAVPQAAMTSATRKILELNGVCPTSRRDAIEESLCAFCRPLKGFCQKIAHISSRCRVSTRRTKPQLLRVSKYQGMGRRYAVLSICRSK